MHKQPAYIYLGKKPQINVSQKKTFQVIVYPKDSEKFQSSEETKQALLKLDPIQLGVKATKVVKVKDKGVLIESCDPTLINVRGSELLGKVGLEATLPGKAWPKMIVFGIPSDFSDNDIFDKIDANLGDNSDIPSKWCKDMFRVGPRNNSGTTNWVLEVHPAVRRIIKQQGRVYFDWKSCNVDDYLRVTRCFKCQKFGHVAKHCNADKQCGYCAGSDHETRDCKYKEDPRKVKCANCARAGKRDTGHEAGSSECPFYVSRLQDLINNTQFEIETDG